MGKRLPRPARPAAARSLKRARLRDEGALGTAEIRHHNRRARRSGIYRDYDELEEEPTDEQ